MKTPILPVLLISTTLPFAAVAQTTAPAGTSSPTPNDGQQIETNQNRATGGMNDTRAVEPNSSAPLTSAQGPFVTVPETGAWRVTDLEGKAVYGADGESIGSIDDVLVSQDGSVNAVIIGVGGFLGIGQKDVAVDMGALQLGPGDTQAEADAATRALGGTSGETTGSVATPGAVSPEPGAAPGVGQPAPSGTGSATGTAGGQVPPANTETAMEPSAAQIGSDALPDRIILNVTRQQLEDAPEFEGVQPE